MNKYKLIFVVDLFLELISYIDEINSKPNVVNKFDFGLAENLSSFKYIGCDVLLLQDLF